nr:hypothetical protein BaRGS_003591 [Batillaria attramentaria]
MIRWEFDEDSLQVFNVTLNDLCSEIERLERRKGPAEKFQYQLPSHEQKPVTISEADAADLKVDLDVLYLKSPYTKQDKSDLKTLADNFFRGGTIDWCAFYSMGLHEVDVKRDIQKELEDYIRDRIESCSPGMLTLYHNPGSGGSTLARRVLWTLHEFAPCVQVKQRTGSSTEEVANKLRFLCDQTQQAIVALMDADDEPKIKQLSQYLQRSFVIILQVKRYPYPIHTPGHCSSLEGTFYLPGVVSKQESIKLVHKLKQKCNGDSTKEQVLETLNAEVEEGNRHQMFEYGMAVYAHEFQGVKTYVRGYLQLDENPNVDLQSWQRCLGYLALVYYYVQIPLPLQFFAGIKLAKPDDRVLTLDNFSEQFKVFVVRDLNEGRNHVFRICHYLIAKEILEQILNRSYIRTQGISDKLSAVAKRQLKSFCLDFISLAAKRNVTTSLAAQTATFTMAKTFIFRDFLERRLAAITGWDQDSRVQCLASGDQFHKKLEDVLLNADRACQNFSLARHYTPPDEEDNYTYMNEIHARLQACGFVNRFYPGGNQAFLSHKTDDATVKSMQAFIQKSLTEIEDLIMECYYVVLVHDGSPLEKYVVWFNSAFKDCAMKLRSMASGSDIESLRLQVAAKKLQLRQDSSVVAVGADMPPEEIESLVGDLEKIFRLVQHHGRGDDLARRKLELDFKDWILAVYMLYAVLEKVRQWHDNAESLNSTFYLFVINSLIGFGTDSHHANPECLDAARYLLQERMQKLSKRNARLKWPKEWLGREDAQGIRRLVSSNSVATDAKERKVHSEKLAVCKGTICSPNTRPLAGHIDLDLGEDVTLKDPVKVFFVPKLAKQYNGSNLEGTKYAGKRVQFHLAFTLANGYEAYTARQAPKI